MRESERPAVAAGEDVSMADSRLDTLAESGRDESEEQSKWDA